MKLFKCLVLAVPVLFLLSCGNSNATSFKLYGAPTLSSVVAADASHGSPTYLTVKLYTVWLSAQADCTNLIVLQDYGVSGQAFDMFAKPMLGSGSPPDGTYNCMVVKQSDTSDFKPAISYGNCTAGSTYSYDIARTASSGTDQWVDQNMNNITTTDGEDIVYTFMTTDASKVTARGASTQQVVTLTTPMVSPGQVTMVLEFTNQVTEVNGHCWLDKGTMSFI
jgi:hypothetical protein